MLTWNELNILSYGAGTPSTTLALMSCQNAQRGPPYLFPKVPIYNAVIFCDLHSEPGWVYEQAAFAAAALQAQGADPAAGRTRPFPSYGYHVGGTAAGQGEQTNLICQPLSAGGNGLDAGRVLRLQQDCMGIGDQGKLRLFCPYHTNYFYHYIREHEPYACALQVDTLVETHQAQPPLKSKLFLSKSRKRLRDLTAEDCQDKQTFLYCQTPVWNGF